VVRLLSPSSVRCNNWLPPFDGSTSKGWQPSPRSELVSPTSQRSPPSLSVLQRGYSFSDGGCPQRHLLTRQPQVASSRRLVSRRASSTPPSPSPARHPLRDTAGAGRFPIFLSEKLRRELRQVVMDKEWSGRSTGRSSAPSPVGRSSAMGRRSCLQGRREEGGSECLLCSATCFESLCCLCSSRESETRRARRWV
jgi:hypothetical protein